MIAIIDYGAGNLKSVKKAVDYLGHKTVVTRDKETILNADRVILPGVGAFGDAMAALSAYRLKPVMEEVIDKNIPFLGICLGLQLLFEESEESPGVAGLGILKGKIKRFPAIAGLKIPQMGWNRIQVQDNKGIFRGLQNPYVYFVHSYYLEAKDPSIVTATCQYGINFDAAVGTGKITLCQFHPEKSGKVGLMMLENFIAGEEQDYENLSGN